MDLKKAEIYDQNVLKEHLYSFKKRWL